MVHTQQEKPVSISSNCGEGAGLVAELVEEKGEGHLDQRVSPEVGIPHEGE